MVEFRTALDATLPSEKVPKSLPAYLPALGDELDYLPRAINGFNGIRGDGLTDQTTKLNAAFNSGAKNIVFPPDIGDYVVDGSISMTVPNIRITGQKGAALSQRMKYFPVFDAVNLDGLSVSNLAFKTTVPRIYQTSAQSRGDNKEGLTAAIYASGSYCTFDALDIRGFNTGIFLAAWSGPGPGETYNHQGNVIRNCRLTDMDFGIVGKGQNNISIHDIYSRDMTLAVGSPNPQHTIYFTGGEIYRSSNVRVGGIHTLNCPNSAALVFKFIDGLECTGLLSDLSGALGMISVRDFVISDVTARRTSQESDDAGFGGFAMGFQGTAPETRCSDGILQNFWLDHTAEATRGMQAFCDRVRGKNINLIMRRTVDTGSVDASLAGSGNDWDINVINKGTGSGLGVEVRTVTGVTTNDNDVRFRGNDTRSAMRAGTGATNTRFAFDPDTVTVKSGQVILTDQGAGTKVKRSEREVLLLPSGGGTVAIDFATTYATVFTVKISDASSYTIGNPAGTSTANTVVGTQIEIVIENASAGALGTVSFANRYTLNAAFTAPASGVSRGLMFRFNGTNWLQL